MGVLGGARRIGSFGIAGLWLPGAPSPQRFSLLLRFAAASGERLAPDGREDELLSYAREYTKLQANHRRRLEHAVASLKRNLAGLWRTCPS